MEEEQIVYVQPDGTPTGITAGKLAAHTAHTKLHLAFSCYVFDERGQILATKRAVTKKVWPGVWTNSVCGHPGPGEKIEDAVVRRLEFELGMTVTDLQLVLPNYTYKTPPFRGVVEHEFCPVYVARSRSNPQPNPAEVAEAVWMTWTDFVRKAQHNQDSSWSWWCQDQLKQLDGLPVVAQYSQPR